MGDNHASLLLQRQLKGALRCPQISSVPCFAVACPCLPAQVGTSQERSARACSARTFRCASTHEGTARQINEPCSLPCMLRLADASPFTVLCHADLRKSPVDYFSAGLVDDDNPFEWDITIIGPVETLLCAAVSGS